jgi:hypothetical protein
VKYLEQNLPIVERHVHRGSETLWRENYKFPYNRNIHSADELDDSILPKCRFSPHSLIDLMQFQPIFQHAF